MSNIVFITADANDINVFQQYAKFSDEVEGARTIADAKLLADIINVAKLQVDIIAIDCDNLPAPLNVIKSTISIFPDIKYIIALISEPDATTVLSLVRQNFSGVISKTEKYNDFCNALKTISEGNFFVSQNLNNKIYETMLRGNASSTGLEQFNLTDKQMKLARLLIDGCSYAVIAQELNIKFESVKQAVNRLYRKINISSRSELTALYYRDRFRPIN